MRSPLQTACEHGGVDLGKGDNSPCWLSTLSCSPAPYIAAAASSRPLSFPTPTLFSASASIPAPTTTSISSLARITGREGSGGEGGEEAAARLPHLCSLPAPAVLLLLPSRSTELPDTNTVDAAINPLSCCSRRSAEFSLLLLLSPSQSTSTCSDRCAHCDAVSTAHGHTDGARTTTRATKSRASFPPCGFGRAPPPDTGGASRSEEDMRGSSPMMRRRLLPPPLLLLLCCSLAAVQPARALFHLRGAGTGAYVEQLLGGGGGGGGGGGYGEEKVPMTVVVPDYSPRPAPFGRPATTPTPAPAPAIPPLPGSDDGGGGDMPTLPSERRSPRGALPGGNAGPIANAGAPSPAAAAASTSTAFISSSPAVPLPAGVTDSATVLPMPTPGQEQHQAVGMGTLPRARTVQLQLAVPLAMMLFFSALR
ncbi:uncharacterized protein LOC127770838 [Oryza glaberrima]|uniref:uncharacterized protein LOC127770838 n=1 Tax=Oryza glaberrima TaxID=4538 RepID=UPI00224C0C6B|nr:uncharacterized protein LOC127770838 [Oryza glaberrima]